MECSNTLYIYLIRHAMTEFNAQKKYMGYTDESVIQEKLEDYEVLRAILKKETIDTIYSSDLIRCQQTTSYLFNGQSFKLDRRLREISFGDWEGKTYEQLKHIPAYCNWLSNWETESIPNGEDGSQFRKRVMQFLQENILVEKNFGKRLVIVSHGGVIRHIVSALCDNLDYWDVHVEFGKAIVMDIKTSGGELKCMSLSVVPTVENANM